MENKETKPKNKFNMWIIPAGFFGAATLAAIIFYMITLNMVIVLGILVGVILSGFSFYKMMGESKGRTDGISEKGPVTGDVNAFVIYGLMKDGAAVADEVQFTNVDPQFIEGLAKWYFEDLKIWLPVLWNDLKKNSDLTPFELPDAAYTDPGRLSIQLNMGRVQELFQVEMSLMDQLKPWILVACITIVGFLIFLSGSE